MGGRLTSQDQAFAGRARVWAANLERIPWSQLTWTARPAESELADDRRAALGGDAWVQQIAVRWALPGERRTAEQELWLTFADRPTGNDGAPGSEGVPETVLAGDGDGPRGDAAQAIWLQQPVRLLRADGALVLTDAADGAEWLSQAVAARRAVLSLTGSVPDPLVVEVPQSRAVFERSLGVSPHSYAAAAAAAWPMGSDTSAASVHVVVNPEASRRLSTLGRDVLLVHEAVHVATRSPGSAVPTWLVEGYADQIAYQAHPAGRVPAERLVRTYVREHGVPKDWPPEGDFAAEAEDLDLSYDLAWTAARSIAEAHGDRDLRRFYAALADGDSVAEAAQRIGTSESSLLRQWHRDLLASAR